MSGLTYLDSNHCFKEDILHFVRFLDHFPCDMRSWNQFKIDRTHQPPTNYSDDVILQLRHKTEQKNLQ